MRSHSYRCKKKEKKKKHGTFFTCRKKSDTHLGAYTKCRQFSQPILIFSASIRDGLGEHNSSTSFCLRSISCRMQDRPFDPFPAKPAYNYLNVFLVTLTLSSSTFYYETDHRKCEITLGGWPCGLRLFKLGRPLHKGFEPRSLAWLACSTGQSATTYTTVAHPYEFPIS